MSNTKFKAGDKVRVKTELKCGKRYYMEDCISHDSFEPEMANYKGKVVTISRIDGSCYNIVEDGEYWRWVDEMFEPVYDKIVITTDGKTTLARLYNGKEVIKSAEAKLSKNDEFDFMVGAKLAFERLAGDSKSNDKIKVGNSVVITDRDEVYRHYIDWVEKNISSRIDRYLFDHDKFPDTTHTFKVVKIAPHIKNPTRSLAYIFDTTTQRCYLFGIEGLKKA